MLIVDAQVHIWAASTPERPWPARHQPHKPEPLTAEMLLDEMKAAGVSKCVLVPPSWQGEHNDVCLAAAARYPDRFAVMGRFDPGDPVARCRLPDWRKQPGMLGLRFSFQRPLWRPLLAEGKADWLWPEAERAGVPVYMLVQHADMHFVGRIAQRHPRLKLVMDHSGLVAGKDDEAFREFDKLLPLAKYPNVATKVSCFPFFTAEAYPFRKLHSRIRQVYDAFGPKRMFWGSDLSRLPCTYKQSLTYMSEEIPWLKASDKESIFGRGVYEWLGWKV